MLSEACELRTATERSCLQHPTCRQQVKDVVYRLRPTHNNSRRPRFRKYLDLEALLNDSVCTSFTRSKRTYGTVPATAGTPWFLDINNLSFKQNILVNRQHHNLLKYFRPGADKNLKRWIPHFLARTKTGETRCSIDAIGCCRCWL